MKKKSHARYYQNLLHRYLVFKPKLTVLSTRDSDFLYPTHRQTTSHRSPHDTTLPPPTQPHPTYSSRHPPLAPFTSQSHTPCKRTFQCAPNTPLNVVLTCPRGGFSRLSVSPQLWRFTNNSLGLPHAHSLSVCLFLSVCVVRVYFLLYLFLPVLRTLRVWCPVLHS